MFNGADDKIINQLNNTYIYIFFRKQGNPIGAGVADLLDEESNKQTQIVMENVFKVAKNEGLLIVPLPSEHDSILEKTTRCIFACLICHSGLGKHIADISLPKIP